MWKPCLEFEHTPTRSLVPGRRRGRRRVKTPELPLVKTVQLHEIEGRTVQTAVRWVSPQFDDEMQSQAKQNFAKSRRRKRAYHKEPGVMQLAANLQMAAKKSGRVDDCPDDAHRNKTNQPSCRGSKDQGEKQPEQRRARRRQHGVVMAGKLPPDCQPPSCSEFSEESELLRMQDSSTRPSNGYSNECMTTNELALHNFTASTGPNSHQFNHSSDQANRISLPQNYTDKCCKGSASPIDSNPGDALHCSYHPDTNAQDLMGQSDITTFYPVSASTPCSERTSGRFLDIPQSLIVNCSPKEEVDLETSQSVSSTPNRMSVEMTVLASDTPSHLCNCGIFCSIRGQCNHTPK